MKRIIDLLSFIFLSINIEAQRHSGWGRGIDWDSDGPLSNSEVLLLLPIGIILVIISIYIKRLYLNRYDDKKWLKTTSYIIGIIGGIHIFVFVGHFFLAVLLLAVLLFFCGYIIYYKRHGGYFGDDTSLGNYILLLKSWKNKIAEIIKGEF